MTTLLKSLLGACALSTLAIAAHAETTLTIATVNNGDMIRMQKLTDDFTKANPRHQAELGDARRERSSPEGDEGHCDQGRPI